MTDPATLGEARARAVAARADFRQAGEDALGWLSPARLRAEAAMAASQQIDDAKDALRRQVYRHPVVAWSALAALVTLITYALRKPAVTIVQSARHAACALYHRFAKRKA